MTHFEMASTSSLHPSLPSTSSYNSACLGSYPSPVLYPDSDSDSTDETWLDPVALEAIISTAPASHLRAVMVKLAASNQPFQHAIARELEATSRHHKSESGQSKLTNVVHCANCGQSYRQSAPTTCVFHPGHLEEEVFDFMSMSPTGLRLTFSKTISMWSCCEDDAESRGCVVAPGHATSVHHSSCVHD
ncbi:hypothetical protein D9758_008549 [Tetrapyrgos nigripes]|uniref:Uncharacterized protein n=1 Tax=Tetrapyrgos nigripes TaxID=182062 RepID=A0A8H5G5L5_9AGAR|nr:hypothetical protein D9758_008549 [Tetrapyrgos nigripes]